MQIISHQDCSQAVHTYRGFTLIISVLKKMAVDFKDQLAQMVFVLIFISLTVTVIKKHLFLPTNSVVLEYIGRFEVCMYTGTFS